MADPELDRLAHRLEKHLNNLRDRPSFEELDRLKKANARILGKSIRSVDKSRVSAYLPDQYHYVACWSLAYAAIELYINETIEWNIGVDESLDLFADIFKTISFDGKTLIHNSKF